jgi:hypothetical protein
MQEPYTGDLVATLAEACEPGRRVQQVCRSQG